MAGKQNCWEFKKCGREPRGVKVAEKGVCLAAKDISAHGLNGGHNGGRICWAIAGSYCANMDCIYATERFSCITCDFLELVEREQGPANLILLKPGQIFFH